MLFPSGCVQQQLNSCSDVQPRHTCHVHCPPCKMSQMAHQRYTLVHMMAVHAAFHYELVTQAVVVLGPSAMFAFVFPAACSFVLNQ